MKTKKIIITGGATRIGAAIAESLADNEITTFCGILSTNLTMCQHSKNQVVGCRNGNHTLIVTTIDQLIVLQ